MMAYIYNLPMPVKSFGAVDGQDFGQDFILKCPINNIKQEFVFDVKTMGRQGNYLEKNWVVNIFSHHILKESLTTY
jgi:hypothetical protein